MRVPALKDEPPYTLVAPGGDDWLQIVGIVGDKKDDGLMKPVAPEAFVPSTLTMGMYTQILVRSDVSPLTLLHAIGTQVSAVDADQQVNANVRDLDHWISGEQYWQQQRLIAWLFGAFAVLALSLAIDGDERCGRYRCRVGSDDRVATGDGTLVGGKFARSSDSRVCVGRAGCGCAGCVRGAGAAGVAGRSRDGVA
jgi:hypothetical protein